MLLAFGQSPAVLTERLVLRRALVGRDPRGGGERDSSGAVVPLGARSLRAVVYLGHDLLVGYLWCSVTGGGDSPACGVGAFPNPLCAVEGRNWVASSGLAVSGWPGACPGLFPFPVSRVYPLVSVSPTGLVTCEICPRCRRPTPFLIPSLSPSWVGATFPMDPAQKDVIASIEAEMHAALSSAAAASALQTSGFQPEFNPTAVSGDVGALPFDLAAEVQALKASSQEFDAEGSVASLGDFMAHASLLQPDSLAGFPSFKTMCPAGKGLHRASGGGVGGHGSGSSGRGSGSGHGSGSGSGWSASDGSDVTAPSPKAARSARKTERARGPAGALPTTNSSDVTSRSPKASRSARKTERTRASAGMVPVMKVTGGVARSTLFGGSGQAGAGGGVGAAASDTASLTQPSPENALDWGDGSGDGSSGFSAEAVDVGILGDSSPSARSRSPPSSFGSTTRRNKVLAKLLRPFKKGDGAGGRAGAVPGSGIDDGSQPPTL